MRFYIAFAHHKADKPYAFEIFRRKFARRIERDIAALDNKVLPVFDRGFDNFADDRPQVFRQPVIVAFRGEAGVSAAYQTHFQVVLGKAGVFVFFDQPLCQQCFAGVRGTGDDYDHFRFLRLIYRRGGYPRNAILQ